MSKSPGYLPYQPQMELVAWAENVWTVEGPEVRYRLAGVPLPCPTRMTVIRLPDGKLWLHSPVAHSARLARALGAIGQIGAIVAPNSYHHLHAGQWAEALTAAEVYSSPDLPRRLAHAKAWRPLGSEPPAHWHGVLAQVVVDLGRFTETVFFHEASRTLIVTDLMQNFEACRIRNPLTRLLLRTGGATGPVGNASIEIRAAAVGRRDALRRAVRTMKDWRPTGIILSHGRCWRTDAAAELERAFAWA